MSVLELPSALLDEIREHARRAYPEECCGVLLGHLERGSGRVRTERLVSASNEREDESRHNRYLISPEVVLRAEREARTDGLQIVGYYHSHPDHPSRPSDFDRDHAWPDTSYLIVSVRGGQVAGQQSWRLLDDRSAFAEEQVVALEPAR